MRRFAVGVDHFLQIEQLVGVLRFSGRTCESYIALRFILIRYVLPLTANYRCESHLLGWRSGYECSCSSRRRLLWTASESILMEKGA